VSLLKIAGVSSTGVAALHVLIIFWGAPGYRYFGAGERMARLAGQGSPVPGLVTAGLAVMFAVWAAYAFSGAGVIGRLPFLRPGLVAIGVVYTLRGLLVGPQLVWFFSGFRSAVPVRQMVFSTAALLTGLAYLIGAHLGWAALAARGSAQRGWTFAAIEEPRCPSPGSGRSRGAGVTVGIFQVFAGAPGMPGPRTAVRAWVDGLRAWGSRRGTLRRVLLRIR
jgi:hypothetical protein